MSTFQLLGLDVCLKRQLDVPREAPLVLFGQALEGLLDLGLDAKGNRVSASHVDSVVSRR
jgi:hypothetical protein